MVTRKTRSGNGFSCGFRQRAFDKVCLCLLTLGQIDIITGVISKLILAEVFSNIRLTFCSYIRKLVFVKLYCVKDYAFVLFIVFV